MDFMDLLTDGERKQVPQCIAALRAGQLARDSFLSYRNAQARMLANARELLQSFGIPSSENVTHMQARLAAYDYILNQC